MEQPQPRPADTPLEGVGLTPHDEEIRDFWERAAARVERGRVPVVTGPSGADALPPPTWSFGVGADQADELLGLVLSGVKTRTSGALWDFEAEGEPLPEAGELSILLDGAGHPRALLLMTQVRIMRFADVDAEHAFGEGEGDRSLETWRREHEHFFTENAAHDRGFSTDLPVVLQSFEVLYQE